jgi:hypothetical protein
MVRVPAGEVHDGGVPDALDELGALGSSRVFIGRTSAGIPSRP